MDDQSLPQNYDTEIIIGTSGYSYPDWRGHFYPDRLPDNGFLDYYSRFFNGLELNYSFYRMPAPATIKRFLHPGYNSLNVSFKAFRGITHQIKENHCLKEFLQALSPLIERNRVKTVLFQFPYSFRPDPEAWDRLEMISEQVNGPVPVLELRHSSWFSPDNLDRLSRMNISVCALDMPCIDDLPGQRLPVTHSVGYMRFHGRNAVQWWTHDQAWQRYDYLYSNQQLRAMVPALHQWIRKHRSVYFFFNNHYRGQAVQNAQLLMAFLAN
ncbi:DUF72 domain-containing protein [bacterium]|nr:DUF72 domain-containing protein [candidate division CSSED10-310 bacterium]